MQLMLAAVSRRADVMRELLWAGASVTHSHNRDTALHMTVRYTGAPLPPGAREQMCADAETGTTTPSLCG
jgi:hypothetical protein